jgi:hypothetical protein
VVLEQEQETYRQRRKELLDRSLGQWVLIRGAEIAGTFDTQGDAIAEGYRRFGNVAFLVKQVVVIEEPARY